jgi:hypothetical protein
MYSVVPDWFSDQSQIASPLFSAQRSPAALAADCASALCTENKPSEGKGSQNYHSNQPYFFLGILYSLPLFGLPLKSWQARLVIISPVMALWLAQ